MTGTVVASFKSNDKNANVVKPVRVLHENDKCYTIPADGETLMTAVFL